ncbi:MAG: hypothetical protein AAFN70_20230, partial [Planctomycetota bacterium]
MLTSRIPPLMVDEYPWAMPIGLPEEEKVDPNALTDEDKERLKKLQDDDYLAGDDEKMDAAGGASGGLGGGMGDMGDMGGYGSGPDYDGGGGMMGGGMMGGGMMGGGMFGGGSAAGIDPPDFKVVRFHDFWTFFDRNKRANPPIPGRVYVYRVRVGLSDPNFPSVASLQPKANALAPEVYDRIRKLEAASEKPGGKRVSEIWTPWSQPSAPVSISRYTPQDTFAGGMVSNEVKEISLPNRKLPLTVSSKSKKAKVVVSQWDKQLGVEVPHEMEALPGTLLAAEGVKVEIVDPIDNYSVRKKEDYNVDATRMLMDFQ